MTPKPETKLQLAVKFAKKLGAKVCRLHDYKLYAVCNHGVILIHDIDEDIDVALSVTDTFDVIKQLGHNYTIIEMPSMIRFKGEVAYYDCHRAETPYVHDSQPDQMSIGVESKRFMAALSAVAAIPDRSGSPVTTRVNIGPHHLSATNRRVYLEADHGLNNPPVGSIHGEAVQALFKIKEPLKAMGGSRESITFRYPQFCLKFSLEPLVVYPCEFLDIECDQELTFESAMPLALISNLAKVVRFLGKEYYADAMRHFAKHVLTFGVGEDKLVFRGKGVRGAVSKFYPEEE